MKRLFTGMILFGFIILLGTAGASDVGNIGLRQICAQAIGSGLFLLTGMLGLRICRIREARVRCIRRLGNAGSRAFSNGTYVFDGGRKMRKTA